MDSIINSDYIGVVQNLKEKIRQSRLRATLAVNIELLKIYWEIGNTIYGQELKEGWGQKRLRDWQETSKSNSPI